MRLARDFAWSIRPRVPPAQRYNVQGNYHRMRESHASLTGDITTAWRTVTASELYVGVITNVLRALQPPRSLKTSKVIRLGKAFLGVCRPRSRYLRLFSPRAHVTSTLRMVRSTPSTFAMATMPYTVHRVRITQCSTQCCKRCALANQIRHEPVETARVVCIDQMTHSTGLLPLERELY